jgi:hypothetical protein
MLRMSCSRTWRKSTRWTKDLQRALLRIRRSQIYLPTERLINNNKERISRKLQVKIFSVMTTSITGTRFLLQSIRHTNLSASALLRRLKTKKRSQIFRRLKIPYP